MKKSSKVLKCESSKGVYLCVSVSLCETVQTIVTYPFLSCGTNITRYVWGLDISGQSGGRASSQAEMQGAGGVGGLCAVFPDNGITPHYPAYDANGNVTEYVDFIGNTIAHYEYDAFGNITGQSGSMADDFVFRFSTKYLDAETGLCYYGRIRYYKPSFGRFISRDPIEEQGGLNLYGFCGNDPINKVDYLGMKPKEITPEGKYRIEIIKNFRVRDYLTDRKRFDFGDPETLDGFQVQYIPAETCQCRYDEIRLVQVVKTRGFFSPSKFDIFYADKWNDKNETTPGGVPVPGYVQGGGLGGTLGLLSYRDIPMTTDELNFRLSDFETCALCDDGTNLGCFTFSFDMRTRELLSVKVDADISASKPGNLWKTAESKWVKAAGTKAGGKK